MIEFLVRYLLCFINSFITFWCFRYLSKNSVKIPKIIINIIFCSFINYYVIFLFGLANIILIINLLIIVNTIWLKFLFHESTILTMIYSFFCDAIMSICFLACLFLLTEFFKITWNEIAMFSMVEITLGMLFQIIYYLFLYNFVKIIKRFIDAVLLSSDKYYFLFILFSALIFNIQIDFFHYKIPITYLIIIYISLTIMFIFTLLFFIRFIKIEREKKIQANIINTINYTEDYLQMMLSNQKELKKIKHELMNQSILIKEMLIQGQEERLLDYLNKFQEDIKSRDITCQSGNIYVDALINHKTNKNNEIDFDIKISELDRVLNIDDFAFCSILGIIFDNAIEANEKMTNKWISFRCILKENNIIIRIKNPIDNISNLKSKKEQPNNHGLGLEILRTIVQNYNGSLTIEQINNVFDLCILLNNEEINNTK